MWESVLGCRGSSLKRGVGEVRRDRGCEKCGGGVRKCVADVGEGVEKWRGGKIWGGVGKCFGCGRKSKEVWESVLGCGEVMGERCREV